MSLQLVLQLLPRGPRFEIELGVDRVEPEEVPVWAVALGRRRPQIAGTAEPVGSVSRGRNALVQAASLWIDVPGEPVGEVARRCIRIVDDQRQRARSLRHEVPLEGRGCPLTVAGV